MRTRWMLALALGFLGLVGCDEAGDDAGRGAATTDTAAAPAADTAAAPRAGGAQAAAQEPDHEFLRRMSDHHEGLVALGMDAMHRATDDSVRTAAHNLHLKQAAERDTMVAMILREYGEQYTPTITAKNRAQLDSLRQTSGAEADRYFLRTTIAHHEEGIGMMDRYLPRSARPQVRRMAEKMRSDQQREIRELRGKLGQL